MTILILHAQAYVVKFITKNIRRARYPLL